MAVVRLTAVKDGCCTAQVTCPKTSIRPQQVRSDACGLTPASQTDVDLLLEQEDGESCLDVRAASDSSNDIV